ncbi:MAG: CotH kinase family protein [Eubacteriales bacterium]
MKKHLTKLIAFAVVIAFLMPLGGGFSSAFESAASTVSETSSGKEGLPRVNIYTDSKEAITKKEYEGATMSIELTDRYADYSNVYTTKAGADIQIRCRGNSTYETSDNRLGDSGKFSYKIKLDTKVNMLGMGKSKHWVLIANYYDVTNMRNKMVYDLSGAMGLTYTQSRWVVVYLNGEYQGLYTLCESIRIEGDRVDITDWEDYAETVAKTIALKENFTAAQTDELKKQMESNLSWVTSGTFRNYKISDYIDISDIDITSGYLLEYDMRQDGDTSKFTTGKGVKIQLDSPTALNTNPTMFNYVKSLIRDMEEAFYSDTFCTSKGVHYSEFVDMQSLVDYFLLFHLFKNIEFGWLSIFLYIEDGTIYFGPCWDFDGSSGNQVTLYEDWMNPERWFYMDGRAEWWKELCGDPYFVTQVEERWQEIKPLLDVYMESLPIWNNYIVAEANANFAHFGAPKNWYIGGSCKSFASEYQIFVNWLNRRIAWLDTQWSMRDPNMEGKGLQSSEKITMSLTYADGGGLSPDGLTVSGAKSDLLYDLSKNDSLKLTISTLHTTHRYALIYVNGKLLQKTALSMTSPATVTIPRGMLNTEPGAVNVIYMVGINHENNYYRASYLTVRMAEKIPAEGQCVLRVGDDYIVASQGEKVTFPEIDVHADGFEAMGWTDGGTTLYKSGETITASQSGYYWIDWKRTDTVAELIIKEGAAQPDDPVVTPPETKPTTTTAKPTTTPQPTTTTSPTTTTVTEPVQTDPPTTTKPTVDTDPPATTTKPATTAAPTTTEKVPVNTPATTTDPSMHTPTPTTSVDLPQSTESNGGSTTALWIALGGILAAIAVAVAVILLIKKKDR